MIRCAPAIERKVKAALINLKPDIETSEILPQPFRMLQVATKV
jgi:hypothetical protein